MSRTRISEEEEGESVGIVSSLYSCIGRLTTGRSEFHMKGYRGVAIERWS